MNTQNCPNCGMQNGKFSGTIICGSDLIDTKCPWGLPSKYGEDTATKVPNESEGYERIGLFNRIRNIISTLPINQCDSDSTDYNSVSHELEILFTELADHSSTPAAPSPGGLYAAKWKDCVEEAKNSVAYMKPGMRLTLDDWHKIYDNAAWMLFTTPAPSSPGGLELAKDVESIRRNAEKINEHTWATYKEQVLMHVSDIEKALAGYASSGHSDDVVKPSIAGKDLPGSHPERRNEY